jgi:hypothetical protein
LHFRTQVVDLVRFRPYEERSIRHIGNFDRQYWTIKVYAIHQQGECVPGPALETGIDLALSRFVQSRDPLLAVGTDWNGLENYGAGVLIIHFGREALFAMNSRRGSSMCSVRATLARRPTT